MSLFVSFSGFSKTKSLFNCFIAMSLSEADDFGNHVFSKICISVCLDFGIHIPFKCSVCALYIYSIILRFNLSTVCKRRLVLLDLLNLLEYHHFLI